MNTNIKNRKTKKGQAALEFMMTYGWALLVLTAMVAGLVYVLPNTRSMTTNKCIFGATIPCLGARLTSDNLTVVLRNGVGITLYNISANITMPKNVVCTVSNTTLRAEEKLTLVCNNTKGSGINVTKDSRIKVMLIYKKLKDGYDQVLTGEMYAKY